MSRAKCNKMTVLASNIMSGDSEMAFIGDSKVIEEDNLCERRRLRDLVYRIRAFELNTVNDDGVVVGAGAIGGVDAEVLETLYEEFRLRSYALFGYTPLSI